MKDSISKEQIKAAKRLHDSRGRAEKGLFLIEGVRLMEEAVKEKAAIKEVLYTARLEETERDRSLLAAVRRMRIPSYRISEKVMEALAETETPQGIVAVVRQLRWGMEDVRKGGGPVIIACGLQDPGNLGTIIRTADAGDCSGVITTLDTVDIYNSKAIRATMGSIFRVPVLKIENIKKAISAFKEDGYQIAATSSSSKTSYLSVDYRRPVAFMIGQEARGLSKELMELADVKVFIPMKEGVESLNAAVSASILIYEALRQRLMRRP